MDEKGYRSSYVEFLLELMSNPGIKEVWSEHGLERVLMDPLLKVIHLRMQSPNHQVNKEVIAQIGEQFLSDLSLSFPEREYLGLVDGMKIDAPLQIGYVTISPYDKKFVATLIPERSELTAEWDQNRYPLIRTLVGAEEGKAIEIFQQRANEALNILRFFGAIRWYREPARRVFLNGIQSGRFVRVISACDRKSVLQTITNYFPLPFPVDDSFLAVTTRYGLADISKWLVDEKRTELQNLILIAIQWFGDGEQDINPMHAFMKYYIVIEFLLKGERQTNKGETINENAKKVLPNRLSYLLLRKIDPHLCEEVKAMVDARNAVFHYGLIVSSTPEALAYYTRQKAVNVLSKITKYVRIPQTTLPLQITTKQELIKWLESKSKQFPKL